MKRPIGVTILAVLAAVIGVIAVIRTIQFLGILPFNLYLGPYDLAVRSVNIWAALMYGLLAWVYFWLVKMLWEVDPSAWLFLAVITVFNLILDVVTMIGSASWSDVSLGFILNAIVLIYIMLPGVKQAFAVK